MAKSKVQNYVRRLRFDNNEMTQAELAKAIGVSRQTVVAIEKGQYSPSLELAFKISNAFGKTVEEIFYIDDGETKK